MKLKGGTRCCLFVAFSLLFATNVLAENPPWFTKLYEHVSAVVAKHYPGVQTKIADEVFYFEKDADGAAVVSPSDKTAKADNAASRERTPRTRGVVGRVELRKGSYTGKNVLPERKESNGLVSFKSAPFSAKCDCHLMVHLYTPTGEGEDFAEELQIMLSNFETEMAE